MSRFFLPRKTFPGELYVKTAQIALFTTAKSFEEIFLPLLRANNDIFCAKCVLNFIRKRSKIKLIVYNLCAFFGRQVRI